MVVKLKKVGKPKQYLSGQIVPQVGNLFIDKLFMTFQIPSNLHAVTIARFAEAVDNWNAKVVYTASYKYCIKLSDGDSGNILIQCDPRKKGLNFFSLQYTPSKADLSHLKTQIDIILQESGGYSGLILKGIVTRIDFTVEASYINPTDILANYPKIKTKSHITKNGIIETKYLGSKTSNKQIALYDKVAEMISKKGQKVSVPEHKLLRIEFRLHNSHNTLKELKALSNPFEGLSLAAYPDSKSMKNYDPIWSLFLNACHFEGVANALQHFNEKDRKFYQNRLESDGKTEWWQPAKIWQGLPDALKVITHVKGYTPSKYLKS